jgi:hypothetical protein
MFRVPDHEEKEMTEQFVVHNLKEALRTVNVAIKIVEFANSDNKRGEVRWALDFFATNFDSCALCKRALWEQGQFAALLKYFSMVGIF